MKILESYITIEKVLLSLSACVVTSLLLVSISISTVYGAGSGQIIYKSPDDAAEALVAASKADDLKAMLAILGPGSRDVISSGDSVADNAGRDSFVASYKQKHFLETVAPGIMTLHVGTDGWPLPIPIVKKVNGWRFDIGKGKKEILNRRIGRNELQVIDMIEAFVDAQHEYASKDCRGTGKVEFAQRFISTPGNRDGLFWAAKEGEQQSPLGPLIAQAAQDGYSAEGNLSPFHGYYFKILKGQGSSAGGGKYGYVVKDRMILGFALVAYPAEHGNSGVMSFVVNQEGVIFEKNLGRDSRRIAEGMTVFNPDKSWKIVKNQESQKLKDTVAPNMNRK